MYYVVKVPGGISQLEGYTKNEFILSQYLKELDYSFRGVDYEVIVSDSDLESLLKVHGLDRLQKIRSYQSADKTVNVYCTPLMFCEWIGLDSTHVPWTITSREKIPSVVKVLMDSSLEITQLASLLNEELRDQLLPLMRVLLLYAVRTTQDLDVVSITSSTMDPVKLMAYVNRFPKSVTHV